MATDSKGTIMCNACEKLECWDAYPRGIPPYCLATRCPEIIEQTKTEYSIPDVKDIYLASVRIATEGFMKWPRIQEAIEFAKELKFSKIGLASCIALVRELKLTAELFLGSGINVSTVSCQIARVSPEERGVIIDPKDFSGPLHGHSCNPIAQAEFLNSEGTQLNFILGLCLGHDILFTRYSKAPVSTLIVKDRVTGNNPGAALYGWHQRQSLWQRYCGQDTR